MNRRSFLLGGAAAAAVVAAPWVITTPGVLMPVKKLYTPSEFWTGTAVSEKGFITTFRAVTAKFVGGGMWVIDKDGDDRSYDARKIVWTPEQYWGMEEGRIVIADEKVEGSF